MKYILKRVIPIVLGIFCLIIPIKVLYAAETVEDRLNNMIGPREQYNTMLSPVYLKANSTEEAVSTQSGELTLAQTDYVLPGINGLDLEIKRIYKSGTSNIKDIKVKYQRGAWIDTTHIASVGGEQYLVESGYYEEGKWIDYTYSDANTSTFYEDRYNLGIGMRFSFPEIELKDNSDGTKAIYLYTELGDIYELEKKTVDQQEVYYPKNQTVEDVKIMLTGEYTNGQSDGQSKYKMEDKNGKKTYFAEDGRILGIVDRYGSNIKFEYTAQTYAIDNTTRTKKLISKITDSVGRIVTIDYNEDYSYTVGNIENTQFSSEDSFKASQNPDTKHSGDLNGKFQVVINLPGDKKIVYDKTAALVNEKGKVIRTRLQRIYDADGKPKYHFWYDQPELGFTFFNGTKYSVYNRYENLTQVDYCQTDRIKRYIYDKYKKGLNFDNNVYQGSMEYQKISQQEELVKKGFDNSKAQFMDKFITEVKDKNTYTYTNEPDGFGASGYKEDDDTYLKDTYRYYAEKTDMGGNKTNYTYNGSHELIKNIATGSNHRIEYITEYDDMKLPKIKETISYNTEKDQPVKDIENFRYDKYGNLTNYTGPQAPRNTDGNPVNSDYTVVYSYAYDKYHTPISKIWKQDENTTCQTINTVDGLGNITREQKVLSSDPSNYITTDFEYDSHGNLTKKTINSKGNNYTTYYEYGADADGTDTKGAYLTREYIVQDGKEVSKKYAYDMTTGNTKSETDVNGNKTTYEYDILGRLVNSANPDNSCKTFAYIDAKNKDSRIEFSDANGTKFANTYDILGNLIKSEVYLDSQWKTLKEVEYDYRGNKTKEKDANGNSSIFEYDSAGQLIKKSYYEKDQVNKAEINLTYTIAFDETTPLLLTITDEDGYIQKYYYDIGNRLQKSETTMDNVTFYPTTYSYDYTGNKVSMTDLIGNKTNFTYDQLGRLTKKTDAASNETSYTYNSLDKALTVDEPGNKETSYVYDTQGRVLEEKVGVKGLADFTYKKYNYDNIGNVLSVVQGEFKNGKDVPANRTEYTYNNMNRVSDEYRAIDDTRREHIKYTYDNNGNKISSTEYTDETGDKFLNYIYKYDFAGKQISEEGSSQELMEDGSYDINSSYRTILQRDLSGNVLKEQKYNGIGYDDTTYTYDYRNKPLTEVEPFKNDGTVKTTEFTYDKRGNVLTQLTKVNGENTGTLYKYDGMGHAVSKADTIGNTTRYIFDANGNIKKEIDPRYQNEDINKAPGIEYEYDALNRQTKLTAFDGSNRTVQSYKEYDGRGNVVKESDAAGYNAENPQYSYGILKEYDAQNNVTKITSTQTAKDNQLNGTANFTKKFAYDGAGRLLSEKDAAGYVTTYEYLLNGKLKTKTDPDSYKTSYDYDQTGKIMTKTTDKAGNITTTWSNIFGKPYRIDYPDNTSETYEYSPKGYVSSSKDKAGNINYYTYDPSGNLLTKKEFVANNGQNNIYSLTVNTYNEANAITSSETFRAEGDSSVSSGNRVTYSYDKAGRVTDIQGPNGRETVKEYDAKGNLLTEKAKVQEGYYDVKRYSYDSLCRVLSEAVLVEMKDVDITKLASPAFDQEFGSRIKAANTYTYYDNGQVKTKKDANDNETSFQYDLDKHPVEKTEAGAGTQKYVYDLKGNLIQQTNSLSVSTYFDYDSMGRLVRKKTPSAKETLAVTLYIYDANGNLKKTIQPNEYKAELDTASQAVQMKGTTYEYDSMNRKITTISPEGDILEKIHYTPMGKVEKTVDGLRLTDDFDKSLGTNYTYDGLGRVLQKTDALGNTIAYEYNILGSLIKETDPRGNSTSYQYAPDGTMTETAYADGTSIEYTYDKLGRKTSQKDQRGFVTEYTYTALGKERNEKDPYNNTVSNVYDLLGNVISQKDKRDNATYISYDAKNRVTEKKTPLELDAAGNVNFVTENYIYDTEGNVISKSVSGTANTDSKRETYYSYYPNNLVKTVSDSSGASKTSSYDLNGNLIMTQTLREDGKSDVEKFVYDIMNRVIKKITMLDEDALALGDIPLDGVKDTAFPGMILMITGLSYDILGNKKKELSPMAYVYADGSPEREKYTTSYSYDELNRLVNTTRKYNDKDVSAQIFYDSVGNKIKTVDELGNEITFTYDSRNRLASQTDSYGNTFSYKYDEAGNKIQETNAKSDSMTYSYDALNRQDTVTDAYGTVIKKNVYDASGNVTKSIDAKGYLSADNDEGRYGTINTYDMANRLVKVVDPEIAALNKPDEYTLKYTYSQFGEKLTSTDALNNTTSYEYDNAGRLVKVTMPTEETVSYGYDKVGNKLYMVDGRGKITRYSYGPMKIVKTVIDADGKEISYRYNLNGNVAEMLDRNGSTTQYIYDNRNLLTQKKVIETGDSVSYTYDAVGNRAAMKDDSGETTYTYDKNNKVTEIVKDGAAQLSYTYDSVGNIESVTDFKGFTTKYTYDKSNRMQTVSFSGNTTTYTYDKNGNRESIEYSGGVKESYSYDKNNKLLTLTNKKPDGGEISKYSYTYYENGLQKTKADSYGTSEYEYDASGRVQKVTTPGKTAIYAYDKAGNRLSQNETYTSAQPTGTIDESTGNEIKYTIKKSEYVYSNTNQLVKLTERMLNSDSAEVLKKETEYYYDANGNQLNQNSSFTAQNNIKKHQTTSGSAQGDDADETINALIERSSNTFDGFNRLKKIESVKDGVRTLAEYTYNGDDLRVRKSVKSSNDGYTEKVTSYLYDRQYVILETDGANAVKARYIKGVNYIAKLDASEKTSYFMYNDHGDVVQTVTASGEVLNQYDYDIWGNPTLTVETEECSIRYAGEYLDRESGLYYLRARYYNSYTGRFMSEDSYWGEDGNPLSLNRYTYCGNDPIMFVDPTGHISEEVAKIVVDVTTKIGVAYKDYDAGKISKDDLNKIISSGTDAYVNALNNSSNAHEKDMGKKESDFKAKYGRYSKTSDEYLPDENKYLPKASDKSPNKVDYIFSSDQQEYLNKVKKEQGEQAFEKELKRLQGLGGTLLQSTEQIKKSNLTDKLGTSVKVNGENLISTLVSTEGKVAADIDSLKDVLNLTIVNIVNEDGTMKKVVTVTDPDDRTVTKDIVYTGILPGDKVYVDVARFSEAIGYGDVTSYNDKAVYINTEQKHASIKEAIHGNTLVITVHPKYDGEVDSAHPDNKESYIDLIEKGFKFWEGEYNVDGKKLNVDIDIKSKNGNSSKFMGNANWDDMDSYSKVQHFFNVNIINKDTRSNATGTNLDLYKGQIGYPYSPSEYSRVASHEFAHVLGVGDGYTDGLDSWINVRRDLVTSQNDIMHYPFGNDGAGYSNLEIKMMINSYNQSKDGVLPYQNLRIEGNQFDYSEYIAKNPVEYRFAK